MKKRALFLSFFLFAMCRIALSVDPGNVIKDTPFNVALVDLYNPSTADAGWCSYVNNPTYGFSSSRQTETSGNKYYRAITTTALSDYHRALAQFTAKSILPGRYKLTLRSKATAGGYTLKLSTKTAPSTNLPANMSDATSGVTLTSGLFTITPTTSWATYSCIFDLNHTASDYIRVFFQFNEIGTYDIDDVELFPYGPAVSGLTIAGKNGATGISTAGGSLQMVATATPSDAAIKAVTWSVDNPLVATISTTGLLIAKGNGTVTVTATTLDGSNITAQTPITITNNTLAEQILVNGQNNNTTISTLGGTLQMSATVKPDNTLNKTVMWSVDNTLLASISNTGLLTAKRDGVVNAIATATDASGVSGRMAVTITGNPGVQSITVTAQNNATTITTAGGSLQMSATVLPAEAQNKNFTWAVDNVQLARITSTGLLTAKKDGVVTVIASSLDGSGVVGEAKITISGNGAISTSDRLSSRFIYFCTDAQCSYKTSSNWASTMLMKNGAKPKITTVAGEYVQYLAATDKMAGNVEIMVYKNTSALPVDNRVKIEVFHNGVSEFFYTDFTSKRDGWYSLGKFEFKGDNTEYVRYWRETGSTAMPTPALPIRFDVYYDTQTRAQTAEEQSAVIPVGFSKTGTWRNSLKSGYRSTSTAQESNTAGSVAIWNPGKLDAGKLELYIYRPKNATNDKYEIFHNSKVDVVYLNNLKQANLNLVSTSNGSPLNPVVAQGWYKIGEYDFSGTGNEFVRLTKATADTTFADCLLFESVKLDGTILHRTVVTTNPYTSGLYTGDYPATLEAKEKATTSPTVGFSPNDLSTISASMYNGSTIYSRALYLASSGSTYYWNPLVVEPGDYEFSFFAYYGTSSAGTFTVKSNGGSKVVTVPQANFVQGQFTNVGTFTFAGGLTSEYIQMTGVNRASDILLEKKISNSAILKQVVVTVHPYFKEYVYDDTKDTPAEHDISFMVKKGFVKPVSTTQFSPNVSMTRAEFIQSVTLMLGLIPNTSVPNYSDVTSGDWFKGYIGIARKSGLLYGIPDTTNIYPNSAITREVAAQILLNTMEYAGRYTNVKNLFKTKPATVLGGYADAGTISSFAREALARMVESRVMKANGENKLLPAAELTRSEATLLLKEYLESILNSGPHSRNTDWEFTFGDEFDGDQLDYTKWVCDDYVRFTGVSAKWKENCVVEDGMFKGYNFLDNHSVPYSSGNIASYFRQTYGFFEARYKYPDKAYGSHSSFWVSTPSYGGDFNFNEGTYPNGISNNNYFMVSPYNFHNFTIPMNMAHDYHTIAGYLNNTDLFYGLDGQKSYDFPNYPVRYEVGKTTNIPYGVWISTIVTYFDGPLDRDRIDGSYMACDWVRVYKEATWTPEVDVENSLPTQNATNQPVAFAPVIKFNKAMDATTITTANIQVTEDGGSQVPSFIIEKMTPLRYRIKFSGNLTLNKTYRILVKSTVKDLIGNTMAHDTIITFTTGIDSGSGVNENSLLDQTTIYPNPGKGVVTVIDEGLSSAVKCEVSVSDISGKVVYRQTQQVLSGDNRFQLDLTHLQSGVYLLNLRAGEKQKTLKLVIKK